MDSYLDFDKNDLKIDDVILDLIRITNNLKKAKSEKKIFMLLILLKN